MIVINDALGWAKHRAEQAKARLAGVMHIPVGRNAGCYPTKRLKSEEIAREYGRIDLLGELIEGLENAHERDPQPEWTEPLTEIEWQAILDAILFTEEQCPVVSDAHFSAKDPWCPYPTARGIFDRKLHKEATVTTATASTDNRIEQRVLQEVLDELAPICHDELSTEEQRTGAKMAAAAIAIRLREVESRLEIDGVALELLRIYQDAHTAFVPDRERFASMARWVLDNIKPAREIVESAYKDLHGMLAKIERIMFAPSRYGPPQDGEVIINCIHRVLRGTLEEGDVPLLGDIKMPDGMEMKWQEVPTGFEPDPRD